MKIQHWDEPNCVLDSKTNIEKLQKQNSNSWTPTIDRSSSTWSLPIVIQWASRITQSDKHDNVVSDRNWATSRENVSSRLFDQVSFKPACLGTAAS